MDSKEQKRLYHFHETTGTILEQKGTRRGGSQPGGCLFDPFARGKEQKRSFQILCEPGQRASFGASLHRERCFLSGKLSITNPASVIPTTAKFQCTHASPPLIHNSLNLPET
jgi:hypothetical protein